VSTASVSRVLNNVGPISNALRDQVESAIQEVGYRPKHSPPANASATKLKTVAIVINDALNPYFQQIVQGAQDEADPNGFLLAVFDATFDVARQKQMLAKVAQLPLDGLIMASAMLSADELIQFHKTYAIPIAVMHVRVVFPRIASIVVDFEGAACRATQHLLDLGHTRIAYLAGPTVADASQARRRGIESMLAARSLTLSPEWAPNCTATLEGGFQSMSSVLAVSGDARPTAIIAYNDLVAIGALNAIRTHGLRVPDDISIMSFDNIPLAAHTNPPLTTVAVPKYQMGKLAIQSLMQIERGELPHGGYTLLESTIIVRDSTMPLTPRG
jgi:DNA-binding LacI/PurR family transcriptional regulator